MQPPLSESDLGVQAGASGGAAAVLALAAAGLCVALVRRRRAAATLAAKARQEQAGVALGSYPPGGEHPLEAPGPGQRNLWFYEQLHATLVRTQRSRVHNTSPCKRVHRVSMAARASRSSCKPAVSASRAQQVNWRLLNWGCCMPWGRQSVYFGQVTVFSTAFIYCNLPKRQAVQADQVTLRRHWESCPVHTQATGGAPPVLEGVLKARARLAYTCRCRLARPALRWPKLAHDTLSCCFSLAIEKVRCRWRSAP